MRVSVPREVMDSEGRVAITPSGVHELVRHGHEVAVESGAGTSASITDEDFTAAGATVLPDAAAVWEFGELVLKVKEPVPEEYGHLRAGQTLFTYLHLAADRPLTEELLRRGVTCPAGDAAERCPQDVAASCAYVHNPVDGRCGQVRAPGRRTVTRSS